MRYHFNVIVSPSSIVDSAEEIALRVTRNHSTPSIFEDQSERAKFGSDPLQYWISMQSTEKKIFLRESTKGNFASIPPGFADNPSTLSHVLDLVSTLSYSDHNEEFHSVDSLCR